MFESDYARTEYIEKDNAVLHTWKKEAHFDDYRKPVEASLEMLYNTQQQIAGNEWLVLLEMYELSLVHFPNSELSKKIKSSLLALSESQDQQRSMINDGLVLAGNI